MAHPAAGSCATRSSSPDDRAPELCVDLSAADLWPGPPPAGGLQAHVGPQCGVATTGASGAPHAAAQGLFRAPLERYLLGTHGCTPSQRFGPLADRGRAGAVAAAGATGQRRQALPSASATTGTRRLCGPRAGCPPLFFLWGSSAVVALGIWMNSCAAPLLRTVGSKTLTHLDLRLQGTPGEPSGRTGPALACCPTSDLMRQFACAVATAAPTLSHLRLGRAPLRKDARTRAARRFGCGSGARRGRCLAAPATSDYTMLYTIWVHGRPYEGRPCRRGHSG